eukprot:2555195-Lingulodinium_polyedra.AAC.1
MAFWEGRDRAPATWDALRREIAAALRARAHDPEWQYAYGVTEGLDVPEAAATGHHQHREACGEVAE